ARSSRRRSRCGSGTCRSSPANAGARRCCWCRTARPNACGRCSPVETRRSGAAPPRCTSTRPCCGVTWRAAGADRRADDARELEDAGQTIEDALLDLGRSWYGRITLAQNDLALLAVEERCGL